MTQQTTTKTPDWAKPERKPENRCPRCWTILTWYEDDVGKLRLWCINCQAPFIDPTNMPG